MLDTRRLSSLLEPAAQPVVAAAAAPADAGGADAGASDSGAPHPDGGAVDPWSWCPEASDAVFDPAWGHRVEVPAGSELCAYNMSTDVKDTLRQAKMLRLIPGEYLFPLEAGTHEVLLPACALGRDGATSALAGPGTLDLEIRPFINDFVREYTLSQPLPFGGAAHTLEIRAGIYQQAAQPLPDLVLNGESDPQGAEASFQLCPASGCGEEASYLNRCAPPRSGRDSTIAFSRGSLTVTTHVYPAFGPTSPAAVTRARGQLDGVSFEQEDYFRLAHRPDHHNHGGGFLVVFDQPIAGACALEAQIPSEDGSFWVDRPAAWLLDCDLGVIEELANVRPGE